MFNEVNVDPTQFFERPLTLAPIVWDTAFTITGYDWWSEYFSITAVQRKLYGYSRARFVFNLRFEYHPTAFHFGDLLIAAAFNHSGISGNNVSCAGGLFHFPHLMLSAANPTVAELQYPFHRIQPYMDLTVAAELTQTGRPIFYACPLAALGFSNGATVPPIPITVRGWLTDLELTGPTGVAPFSQSGPSPPVKRGPRARAGRSISKVNSLPPPPSVSDPPAKEEGATGPVSRVAGMIADGAAAVAEAVPVLSPWATTISTAASIAGSVAAFFGLSAPTDDRAPTPVVSRASSSFALADVPSSAQRTTLMSTSALTISGALAGGPEADEMSLATWFSHESYLGTIAWTLAQTTDTVISVFPVTPRLCPTGPSGTKFAPTSLLWASMPFTNWRGSIIYKFHVSASNQHRGRLRLVYEPVALAAIGTEPYGIRANCVLDLDSERDLEVCVSWASDNLWLVVGTSATNDTCPAVWASTTAGIDLNDNGRLFVIVEAPLIAPQTTNNDVSIIVTIRGGPDYMVANPDTTNLRYWTTTANQAGKTTMPVDRSIPKGALVPSVSGDGTRICCINGQPSFVDNIAMATFGEVPVSIRSLIKRFCTFRVLYAADHGVTNFGTTMYQYIVPMYPLLPQLAGQISGAEPSGAVARSNWTWVSWFSLGYATVRGSMRWRAMSVPTSNYDNFIANGSTGGFMWPDTRKPILMGMRRSRANGDFAGGRTANLLTNAMFRTVMDGAVVCNDGDGMLDIEIPPNIYWQYVDGRDLEHGFKPSATTYNLHWNLLVIGSSSIYVTQPIILSCAAGEDLSMSMFVGPSVLDYNASL
jgi:hypothetical protein